VASSDGHLSDDDIDLVLGLPPLRAGSSDEAERRERVSAHVQTCSECADVVEAERQGQESLMSLRDVELSQPTADCPPVTEWDAIVAAGPSGSSRGWLHAANCGHCGPLLRAATEDAPDDDASEDQLSALAGASAVGQRAIALRMARPRRRPPAWYGTLAAAAVLTAAVAGWLLIARGQPSTSQLLATAYAGQRSLVLRLGESPHSPVRVQRAGTRSRLDRHPALLEAEARISRVLERHPLDVDALHDRGRAEILESSYAAAVESLKRAEERAPGSAAIKRELATAYFMRGQAEDHATDNALAFETLSAVLLLTPNDPIALFNRAIVAEFLGVNEQAAADWQRYLALDPSGPWSDEARDRLARLEDRRRKTSDAQPLLEPEAFAESSQQPPKAAGRDEQYLHVAVRDWLPAAFADAERKPERGTTARRGLNAVARVFQERHGDSWLGDLLAETPPSDGPAVTELAHAVRAADDGDFDGALTHARRSAALFDQSGNRAGALRAQAEIVYGLHLSERASECVREAMELRARLPSQYPTLSTRVATEYAICSNMAADVGNAEVAAGEAIALARNSALKVAELRAATFAASLALSTGDPDLAMKRVAGGLETASDGGYPRMRTYSLLTVLDSLAEERKWWQLQLAVAREEVGLLEGETDTLLRAMAHRRLGHAAMMAGDPASAAQALGHASALFARCAPTASTRNSQTEAEVWLARLEMEKGDFEGARRRLAAVEGALGDASSRFVSFDFQQTLGQTLGGLGNPAGAEAALRRALAIREDGLRTIGAPADRVAWQDQGQQAFRSLTGLLLDRSAIEAALGVWEDFLGSASGGIAHRDLASLRSRLKNETVLALAFIGHGIAAWVYDDRLVAGSWLPARGREAEELASRFARGCADPRTDEPDLRVVAGQLYQLLVKPLEGSLDDGRPLVVEADGALAGIPFEALVDGEGRRLGDRHSITMSGGLYSRTRGEARAPLIRDARVLVVAPRGGEGVPLADASEEAHAVAGLLPAARVLVGSEATSLRVERELADADLFHFAGHTTAYGRGVDLAFESDGPGGEARLSSTAFGRIRLAVLSACSSGGTRLGASAGSRRAVIDLTAAGVPHVVASLWDVDSAATRSFMEAFYGALLQGNSVGESVRLAAARVRDRPGWSHPYYWAAFQAFGRV
jgi:CHAT domain-containing protein/tetratricopeptide (TPR) repeat protein